MAGKKKNKKNKKTALKKTAFKKTAPKKSAPGKPGLKQAPARGKAKSAAKGGRRPGANRPAAKRAAPAPRKAAPSRPSRAAVHTAAEAARLERNKQLVLTMYQKLIGEGDFEAARQYMGDTYRQHSAYAADGHDGVRNWLVGFKQAFPNHRYEVKKVLAEGNLVVLHLHGINGPNPHGEQVVDFFRIENGKVVEHWDVIQAIADSAQNDNSVF